MLTAKEDQAECGNVIIRNDKKILTIIKKYVRIYYKIKTLPPFSRNFSVSAFLRKIY